MVVDDDLSVPEVCRNQDMDETAVRRGVDQLKAEQAGQPLTTDQQRIRQLEQENRQMKEDKEILKRHCGFTRWFDHSTDWSSCPDRTFRHNGAPARGSDALSVGTRD